MLDCLQEVFRPNANNPGKVDPDFATYCLEIFTGHARYKTGDSAQSLQQQLCIMAAWRTGASFVNNCAGSDQDRCANTGETTGSTGAHIALAV